jgi:hypothetical protein
MIESDYPLPPGQPQTQAEKWERIKNMVIYFLNSQGKPVDIWRVMEFLHTYDMQYYKQTAFSMTGLNWFAWTKGPFNLELYNWLKNNFGVLNG